jgi:hypothetical protein
MISITTENGIKTITLETKTNLAPPNKGILFIFKNISKSTSLSVFVYG